MAEKYATLVASQPDSAQVLARQFAIGVLAIKW
jgi:hypothetical protein